MFIHLSLHESVAVIGMPGPEMNNEFTLCCQIVNSLESVGMEGTRGYGYPWIVKEWWEKEYTLFDVWEPPMMYIAWIVLGITRSFLLIGKVCLSKYFISQFKL